MKAKNTPAIFFLFIAFCTYSDRTFAQNNDNPFGSWLIPGIRYHASENFELLVQQAWLPQKHISFSNVQGYYKLDRHTTLTSAFMYIDLPDIAGENRDQYTFLNGIVLSLPVKKTTLEYRGLLWNRLITHGGDRHLFRNRFKTTVDARLAGWGLHLYVFDEVTFDVLSGAWDRNRIGPGIMLDLTQWLSTDLAMARQADKRSGNSDLLFVTLTCRLPFADTHH